METNQDVAKGQWNEVKAKIKSKWAKLTDQDLKAVEGNFEELKGKLRQAYGYSKEKVEEEFEELKNFGKKLESKFADRANAKIDVAKKKTDDAIGKMDS